MVSHEFNRNILEAIIALSGVYFNLEMEFFL